MPVGKWATQQLLSWVRTIITIIAAAAALGCPGVAHPPSLGRPAAISSPPDRRAEQTADSI